MAKIDLPKRSGKRSIVSEKSGNFENDIEWQPCGFTAPTSLLVQMWIKTHRYLVGFSLSMHHLQKHINQDIKRR